MSTQLDFDLPPVGHAPPAAPSERPQSLVERFAEFHATHPHVYAALRKLALDARGRGRERIGMKQLFEVLRWFSPIDGRDAEAWKLNNSYTAPYARMLMEREPSLAGCFETRRSAGDGE